MAYTLEQIEAIKRELIASSIKDTQLPITTSVNEDDYIPIVQGLENKIAKVSDVISNTIGFYTIDSTNISLSEAIEKVPVSNRKPGAIISFFDKDVKDWVLYQFKDSNLNYWNRLSNWEPVLSNNNSLLSNSFSLEDKGYEGELRVVKCPKGQLSLYIYSNCKWIELYHTIHEKISKYEGIFSRDAVGYDYTCSTSKQCKDNFPYRRGNSIYQLDSYGNEVWLYDVNDNFDSHILSIEEGTNMTVVSSHEGVVTDNTLVTIKVVAKEGYEFVKIIDSHIGEVFTPVYSFNIHEDRYIEAQVRPISVDADIFVDTIKGVDSVTAKFDWAVIRDNARIYPDEVRIDGVNSIDNPSKTFTQNTKTLVELYKQGTKLYEEVFDVSIVRTPDPIIKEKIVEREKIINVPTVDQNAVNEGIRIGIEEYKRNNPPTTNTTTIDNTPEFIPIIDTPIIIKAPGLTTVTYSWKVFSTKTNSFVEKPATIGGKVYNTSPAIITYNTTKVETITVLTSNKQVDIQVDPTAATPTVTPLSFQNGDGYTVDSQSKTINIANKCFIGSNDPYAFEVRIPFTGDFDRFALENGITQNAVQIRKENNMIIIKLICQFLNNVGSIIAKLFGVNGDTWSISTNDKKTMPVTPKVNVNITKDNGVESYKVNNTLQTGNYTGQVDKGSYVTITDVVYKQGYERPDNVQTVTDIHALNDINYTVTSKAKAPTVKNARFILNKDNSPVTNLHNTPRTFKNQQEKQLIVDSLRFENYSVIRVEDFDTESVFYLEEIPENNAKSCSTLKAELINELKAEIRKGQEGLFSYSDESMNFGEFYVDREKLLGIINKYGVKVLIDFGQASYHMDLMDEAKQYNILDIYEVSKHPKYLHSTTNGVSVKELRDASKNIGDHVISLIFGGITDGSNADVSCFTTSESLVRISVNYVRVLPSDEFSLENRVSEKPELKNGGLEWNDSLFLNNEEVLVLYPANEKQVVYVNADDNDAEFTPIGNPPTTFLYTDYISTIRPNLEKAGYAILEEFVSYSEEIHTIHPYIRLSKSPTLVVTIPDDFSGVTLEEISDDYKPLKDKYNLEPVIMEVTEFYDSDGITSDGGYKKHSFVTYGLRSTDKTHRPYTIGISDNGGITYNVRKYPSNNLTTHTPIGFIESNVDPTATNNKLREQLNSLSHVYFYAIDGNVGSTLEKNNSYAYVEETDSRARSTSPTALKDTFTEEIYEYEPKVDFTNKKVTFKVNNESFTFDAIDLPVVKFGINFSGAFMTEEYLNAMPLGVILVENKQPNSITIN